MRYTTIILFMAFLTNPASGQQEVDPLENLSGTISKNRFSTYVHPGARNLEMSSSQEEMVSIYLSFPKASSPAVLEMNVLKADWSEYFDFKIIVEQISYSAFPLALFAPSVPAPPDSIRSAVEHLQNQNGEAIGLVVLKFPDSVKASGKIRINVRAKPGENNLWQFRIAQEQIPKESINHSRNRFYYFKFSSFSLWNTDETASDIKKSSWCRIKLIYR